VAEAGWSPVDAVREGGAGFAPWFVKALEVALKGRS